MSSNVGLATPRGTGTSGYVQRNLSHLRPRDDHRPPPDDFRSHAQRQPDAAILEHDRRRKIEVEVFSLRDKLEEEGADDDDVETQCEALRRKLTAEATGNGGGGDGGSGGGKGDVRGLKSHQVHEIAAAKIREDEKVRRALGIRGDYEEGGHWKRQEEKRRGQGVERVRQEVKADAKERRRSRSPVRAEGRGRRSPSPRRVERSRSRSPRRGRSPSTGSGSYSD